MVSHDAVEALKLLGHCGFEGLAGNKDTKGAIDEWISKSEET